MKQLTLLIVNSVTFIVSIFVNYLAGTGYLTNLSISDISAKYETLFTPASFAFSIWGIIYLLLFGFIINQWVSWFKYKDDEYLIKGGLWFALSNIANSAWIYVWLNEAFLASILLMLILLISLIVLTIKFRLEMWDAPMAVILFVWWPICIYLGWIVTATVANFSVFFASIGWYGKPFSEVFWTITMIVAAGTIYELLIIRRNMREAALVGVWALSAIAVKQWDNYIQISVAAIVVAMVLFMHALYHAYKNSATSPCKKMRNNEWR